MFKLPDKYFNDVKCPEARRSNPCVITGCIFNHGTTNKPAIKRKLEEDLQKSEVKKLKKQVAPLKEVKEPVADISFLLPTEILHLHLPRTVRIVNVNRLFKNFSNHSTPKKAAIDLEYDIALKSKSLNEYNSNIDKYLGAVETVEQDPKYIVPKLVISSPASYPDRKAIIEHMVAVIRKTQPQIKTPILIAIEEEYNIASKSTSFTYKQSTRNRLHEISKGNLLKASFNKPISEIEYYKHLQEYVIPISKLEKFGYIVRPPNRQEPSPKRVCKRCNNPFLMSQQLEPIECHYHSGKPKMGDLKTKYYECCGTILGGDPCCQSIHHVFHWETAEEMEYAIPFKNTKDIFPVNNESFKALGIDCEMGYTTKGFELLRISAIDFFSGEEVLDLMVRPYGTVVDLNTRWSGVSSIGDDALSFTELITLLGSIMDQNTILVGHGLENDLRSMRLIHERIVDTAILFPPHKATPTFRFSLKHLAFKYLSRDIQSGEHDSNEDSLAAIDITKYFIQRKINPPPS